MPLLRHSLRLAAALAALAAPLASHAADLPSVPAYKEIRDWVIGCDNTRSCEARGFSAEHLGMEMFIRRDAGPDAPPHVTFEADIPLDGAKVTLDGKALPLVGDGVTTRTLDFDNPGSTIVELAAKPAMALLNAIHGGTVLSFGPPQSRNGDGDSDPTVSLKGLVGALAFMDQIQGRDGGTAPPPTTTPPAPVAVAGRPLSEAAQRSLIRALRNGPLPVQAGCDDTLDQPQDLAYALGTSGSLVLIECRRSPYQSTDLVLRLSGTDARTARPVALALPLAPQPLRLLDGAGFDPGTATLSMMTKGRGINDCGATASWVFDGKDFVLASYGRQDSCGGVESGNWPVLWRVAEQ